LRETGFIFLKSEEMDRVGISIAIPALDDLEIVQYAFTTRQNGLGARVLGLKQADDWKPVADAFGIAPDRMVTVNQVHGVGILRIDGSNYRSARSLDADAMITRERGIAIGVETADCVPILLVDPASPAVAAVHAGWRSTVQRIVQKAVESMAAEFGSDASRIIAAIGPAICGKCYEVDEPVMGPVRTAFPYWKEVASPRGQDKWSLDLGRLNRRELIEAGLPPVNIYSFGLCTSCNPDLFYSFRREGRTGRMLSVVMIKP
jgi:YfiH family protein